MDGHQVSGIYLESQNIDGIPKKKMFHHVPKNLKPMEELNLGNRTKSGVLRLA